MGTKFHLASVCETFSMLVKGNTDFHLLCMCMSINYYENGFRNVKGEEEVGTEEYQLSDISMRND